MGQSRFDGIDYIVSTLLDVRMGPIRLYWARHSSFHDAGIL